MQINGTYALKQWGRLSVFLSVRYGWSYQEIEEKTGVPASTVGDWMARARKEIAGYHRE